MRLYILTVVVIFFSVRSFAQCDTVLSKKDTLVKEFLLKLEVNSYKGIQIGSFLKMDSIRNFCRIRFLREPAQVCTGLAAYYKGFITLNIYISQVDCGGFVGDSKNWDIEKLKKCKIYKVEVLDFTNVK
jgi:hypothetical protein